MTAWIETKAFYGNDKNARQNEQYREFLTVDCDEQKTKTTEYIHYVGPEWKSVINHFVYGEKPCELFGIDQGQCWPPAYGEPKWDRVVPESIMEDIVHAICAKKT